jgi:6-phosphogluconate dehydrogenase
VFLVVKRGSERSFYHAWGQKEAYELVAPILKQIAAVAEDGEPCVTYIGADGAGHYVKMVHNGIEYGDMQLIAEAYALLKGGLAL